MAERRDILWRFLGDSKNLQQATRGATKGLSGTQKAFGAAQKAAIGFGAAMGAREVLQFGQDAITAASDFTESMNAIEVATGAAADDIARLGDEAATKLGLSKVAVNDAAVAFAAFGEKIDADGNISDTFEEYVTRATDFASVMNLDVTDALAKFQSGLAGESEPLRRWGLDMSAAAVSAFAMSSGIVEAGEKLTEGQKVQARYGLLLQQTDKFAGDFANTQGEVANQTRIANAEFENAQIALGEELMPLQENWVMFQRSVLIPTLISVSKEYGGLADQIAVAADGGATFEDRLEDGTEALRAMLDKLNPVASALGLAQDAMGLFGDSTAGAKEGTKELNKQAEIAALRLQSVMRNAGMARAALAELGEQAEAELDLSELAELAGVLSGIQVIAGEIVNTGLTPLEAVEREQRKGERGQGGGEHTKFQHAGGVVPGARGQNVPIMAQGGEHITPLGSGGGGGIHIEVNMGVVGDPDAAAQAIVDLIQQYELANGTRQSGVA